MYSEAYEPPTPQYVHPDQYGQTPQYTHNDQFNMFGSLPQMSQLPDQDMLLRETTPQDPNLFQLPPDNQIPYQEEQLASVPLDESLMQAAAIPPMGMMDPTMAGGQPQTEAASTSGGGGGGSGGRVTRSRLRSTCEI